MKKSIHNALLGVLGTTLGMYMVAAPLTTVYANEPQAPSAYNNTVKMDSQRALNQMNPNPKNITTNQDPVEAVKASADKLGFNVKIDSFSLINITATTAVVKVIHGGSSYNVTLKYTHQDNSQWTISSVSKASNMNNTASTGNSNTISSNSSTTPSTNSGSSSDTGTGLQKAVDLLNADRLANGLAKLQVNAKLNTVAQKHAQDMITRNFFSHTNPDGQSPFDRIKQAGIPYSAAGENIAGDKSVQAAEVAFMNSSGHRANILNPSYTSVGIGVAYDANGKAYVVQDFIKS